MESLAGNPAVIWLAGIMGSLLLTVVGVFLYHFYKSTNGFMDEARESNAVRSHQLVTLGINIDGVKKDIEKVSEAQGDQEKWLQKMDKKIVRIETKLGIEIN